MKKKYLIVIILMLLVYMSICGNYINSGFDDNIMYLYSLIDFLVINTIMILVPLIFKLSGNINQKNGNKICKYNSVILFIISVLLNSILKINFYFGIGGIGAIVYYFINIKLFVNNQEKNSTDSKIKTKRKNKYSKDKIIIYIFLIILVILSCLLINNNSRMVEQEVKIKELQAKLDDYAQERTELIEKNYFFDKHVVFIISDSNNKYVSYNCMKYLTQGKNYKFLAYNTEQAISEGYQQYKCSIRVELGLE